MQRIKGLSYHPQLRWLERNFQRQYFSPSFRINYVAINKDIKKRFSQLKVQCYVDLGVVLATNNVNSARISQQWEVFCSQKFVYNCVRESVNEIFWDNFFMVKLNIIQRGRLAFTQSLILICALHILFCINSSFISLKTMTTC